MVIDHSTVDDEALRKRRQFRHLRTAITLLGLVIFVVIAAWISWRQVTGGDTPEPRAQTTCAPAATTVPAPADIQLNIFNATSRAGLASAVSDQMIARGFTVVDVANDPLDREVEGTAEVRAHLDQQAAASAIMAQVPGAIFVADERAEPTVDLVLGEAFQALGDPAAPAPAPTSTPCAAPAS